MTQPSWPMTRSPEPSADLAPGFAFSGRNCCPGSRSMRGCVWSSTFVPANAVGSGDSVDDVEPCSLEGSGSPGSAAGIFSVSGSTTMISSFSSTLRSGVTLSGARGVFASSGKTASTITESAERRYSLGAGRNRFFRHQAFSRGSESPRRPPKVKPTESSAITA